MGTEEKRGKCMDLFDYMKEKTMENESPLASRMRPATLEEVVGQEHIVGKGKLLYRAIKADKLSSIIFYLAGYGENHAGPGDCQYYQCPFYSAERHYRREKRYGRSGEGSAEYAGDVWEENDSFCG